MQFGVVATPYNLLDPKEAIEHQKYLKECARTMSVSVILDTGEFLPNCRILLSGPSNKRQLPRFPRVVNKKIVPGDTVVVSYVHGLKTMPLIVGVLAPILPPAPATAKPRPKPRRSR